MATRVPSITLAMYPDMQTRLKLLAERANTSAAKVVESLLLMDDDAILEQIERAKETIAQRKRERLDRKKEIVSELSKLSPDQLDALMKKVKSGS